MALGDPLSLIGNARERNSVTDKRLDTFMFMQLPSGETGVATPGRWSMSVPNGVYILTASVGDPIATDSHHVLVAEGVTILDFTPSPGNLFKSVTVPVVVSDEKLTIDASGGTNTKLNYIDLLAFMAVFTTRSRLSATGAVVLGAQATLKSRARLSATGTVVKVAHGSLRAVSTLRASGTLVVFASASFNTRAVLGASQDGATVIAPAIALNTVSTLSATGVAFANAGATFGLIATLRAPGEGAVVVTAPEMDFVLNASLAATATYVLKASARLTLRAKLKATAVLIQPAPNGAFGTTAELAGEAPAVIVVQDGAASLLTRATLGATGALVLGAPDGVISTRATLSATAVVVQHGGASFAIFATLVATPLVAYAGEGDFIVAARLFAEAPTVVVIGTNAALVTHARLSAAARARGQIEGGEFSVCVSEVATWTINVEAP